MREDEDALVRPPAEVGRRVERHSLGRALDRDAATPEEEEIEVELAGTPAPAITTPERPLDALERDEERERARSMVRPCGDIERDDGLRRFVGWYTEYHGIG